MTGTAGGVETIVADLLFVLCKENRKWVFCVTNWCVTSVCV